jgi:signal transduction histidine kinase
VTTASVSVLDARSAASPMSLLLVIGVAGAAAAGGTAWLVAGSPILLHPKADAIGKSLIVASFVGVGAYTWWRRPDSPLGPLLGGYGFLQSATALQASGAPVLYTLGMTVWVALFVYAAFMILCFPRGLLESRTERRLILTLALSTALLWILILALSPTLPSAFVLSDCGTRCPGNALRILTGAAGIGGDLDKAYALVSVVADIGIAILIVRKARSSAHLRRRAIMPLTVVFIATIASVVAYRVFGRAGQPEPEAVVVLVIVMQLAIPLAMLAGQVRGDLFAAATLSRLALRRTREPITAAKVQDVIGDALGDPTLTLALWSPERATYLDVYGRPLQLPRETTGRAITAITSDDGQPSAALIHQPTLDTGSDLVQGLAATSLMLLENAHLVEELGASRARMVEAADRERRRLERDLHDGAQQRLIAAVIKLSLAAELVGDNAELRKRLDASSAEVEAAIRELRALAHGVYPTVLADFGLSQALAMLAVRFPGTVEVTEATPERFPPDVEHAIYYCCLEAVQNAAKHGGPHAHVSIRLRADAHELGLEVRDDGPGFDVVDAKHGLGLENMRDRLGAAGGHIEITSHPGHGTRVAATIPLSHRAVDNRPD